MEDKNEDLGIYDRQIRLFGHKTQDKIQNIILYLCTEFNEETINEQHNDSISYAAAEILKNFVLLGIKKAKIDRNTFISFEKMSPNKLEDINENLDYEIINEDIIQDNDDSNIIKINVDCNILKNAYFICTKCYSYDREYHQNCNNKNKDKIVFGCLIGAIFVQEMIKMCMKEKFETKFTLNI